MRTQMVHRRLFSSAVRINRERLLEDLHSLRSFGAAPPYVPGAKGGDGTPKGVVRPALTEPDIEAREWLMEKSEEAGLHPIMDKLGNTLSRSGKKTRVTCCWQSKYSSMKDDFGI